MKKNITKDQLIEKFLTHTMTPNELITFKNEWKKNPDFVKEVQDYSMLIISIKTIHQLHKLRKKRIHRIVSINHIFRQIVITSYLIFTCVKTPISFTIQHLLKKIQLQDYCINHNVSSFKDSSKLSN